MSGEGHICVEIPCGWCYADELEKDIKKLKAQATGLKQIAFDWALTGFDDEINAAIQALEDDK